MLIDTCVLLMGNELLENLVDAIPFILLWGTERGEEGQGHGLPYKTKGDGRSPG